jgi:dolichol-phosphate mannosyltransferase
VATTCDDDEEQRGAALSRPSPGAPIELTVVVPTFNEHANIPELLRRLDRVLAGINWEAIFVDDDSSDGTADEIRTIAQTDTRVRCIQRIGRRGLASACVEGALASSAPFIAVLDADLQHDESILPAMLGELKNNGADVVVGSRYMKGGGIGKWHGHRAAMSRIATKLSRAISHADISDPMSGFFIIRRTAFMAAVRNLSSIGFKILIDLFASSPRPLVFREIPYIFRARQAGESKLDSTVIWQFLLLLTDKLVGKYVPVRFLSFLAVGGFGVLVHMAVLATALKAMGLSFELAQTGATIVAMTANFFLNNVLTYRDLRLKGWQVLRGLITFYAVCGLGAVANVGVAGFIFGLNYRWWFAGLVGVLIGAVWNYVATALFTWKRTSW